MRAHAASAVTPSGRLLTSIRLGSLLRLCASTLAYAAHVGVHGRQIVVDGKPLFLKGINWNPVPKGAQQGDGGVHFRGYVESDGELMAAAGINAVRTYAPITDTDVLDLLWQKGIYVLNTVYITGDSDPKSVVKPVSALRHHPAILMWVIGNEWNYNMLYSKLTPTEASERVRTVARLIKSLDSTHPVASVYGMVPPIDQLEALAEVDVWGLTAYTGLSFGSLFDTWASRSEKPMFVAEYGADAYNAMTGSVDEADQATATKALTEEVIANSALDGGACSGGLIFELGDEWWKDASGSPERHNRGGVAPGGGPFPDSTFNEEYWGLVSIDGTPRQAYAAYAAIGIPGAPAPTARRNITAGFRMKACGANPGCVGGLGDCCPGKDGTFRECCSAASKLLHRKQAKEAARPDAPGLTPSVRSHQTPWTAGAAPAHCEAGRLVPCCPAGSCGSCAGSQCCPGERGSTTCPSAPRAKVHGCDRPKLYDCTGRTGTGPEEPAGTTAGPRRPRPPPGAPSAVSTTAPRPALRASAPPQSARHSTAPQAAKVHSEHFGAHAAGGGARVRPEAPPAAPPSTTPAVFISLHTTMRAPPSPAGDRPAAAWILGPERESCAEVCRSAGGCVEGSWPSSPQEFMSIASGLGYVCFDLQEGGGKFDPSTQQGNCGWKWNGGRELLSTSESATPRCATAAPSFTRRFCPCRSKAGSGHGGTKSQEPALVMERLPSRGWILVEGVSPGTAQTSLFA